jgi:hypothetical protein
LGQRHGGNAALGPVYKGTPRTRCEADSELTMYMDRALQALQLQIDPLQRFVELFAASLDQPQLCQLNGDRGFRYEVPDVRHFCLLKAARAVSALNACIELARGGYTQEIGTLIRTMAEFTTLIEFVLDPEEKDRSNIEKYVQEFFTDSRRGPAAEIKRAQVRQGVVHESLGRKLDDFAKQEGETAERSSAEALYSNVYRVFSNYVHGKYPEVMDMYGGTPGHFHLRGMRGTPKDAENLELLNTYILTVANALVAMIQSLDLREVIRADAVVVRWFRERFEEHQR